MRLTTAAFTAMTRDLRAVADQCCGGRLVVVTEGGYDLRALADCLSGAVDVLGAESADTLCWPTSPIRSSRGADGVRRTKAALSGFWKLTG
jgi:acetoin utilization deacetylase AcuC-like enzyme